jgi:YidC/Oxa1 family membrane protein insertase
METKRLILLMVIGFVLILGWQPLIQTLTKKAGYQLPAPATQPAVTSTDLATSTATPGVGAPSGGTATTTGARMGAGGWTVDAATGEEKVDVIGSAIPGNPAYALEVGVSTIGAGLDHVTLNDYKLSLRKGDPFIFQRPGPAPFAEQTRSLAVRNVTIDGTTINLTGAKWTQVSASHDASAPSQSLSYELPLSREGKVALVLRRDYTVYRRDAETWKSGTVDAQPLGFETSVVTTFVNKSDHAMNVSIGFNAVSVPPSEAERYADGTYVIGFSKDGVVLPESHMVDAVKDQKNLLDDAKGRVPYWFGAATSYFMALQRFEPLPQSKAPVDWFKTIDSKTLTPDATGVARCDEIVITTKDTTVAPAAESRIPQRDYFGPRKREYLTNAHYSAPWIQYDRALVIVSGICGICTWQWLIDILFAILKGFHAITRDWGLSIIGLVFLVRLILHPITRKAQWNMLKFGKLAPEMTKIKERHKDDQEAMNRAMMAFYKEHGATQAMGCLPMFLQMPVWIALWQAMNTTFELRHQPFLYNLTWIHDLSKPDHLIDFANYGWAPIQLPSFLRFITISGVNVLPFVYGIVQFIQFKIQPKPPTTTPEQAQQQAMTQWMILIMMPILLYASPSGLMIYMITSFLIGIFESKLVKRQFEREQANEAKFTIVENDSPIAATATKATVRRKEDAPKKSGLAGIIEQARQKMVEAQQEIEKNRKRPK